MRGMIRVSSSSHGVTLSLTVPGFPGWIVTRPTLPEALAALAANLGGGAR